MESVVGFSSIPPRVFLNDREWPFYITFCIYAWEFVTFVGFVDSCVQTNKDMAHTIRNANVSTVPSAPTTRILFDTWRVTNAVYLLTYLLT